MEVPIDQMPQPARSRIESLMRTMGARCSIEKRMQTYGVLEKFYANLPGFIEKQVGDGEIEEWVFDRLKRDDDWIEETAWSLFEEAVATREETVRAQLCSAVGKDVPEGYELSASERDEAWGRAVESAQSIADTYNSKLRDWIEEAKGEWWQEHGESFVGLNRWTLLRLTSEKVEAFNEWKTLEISATEFTHQWQEQALSFWIVNRGTAELEYYLAPEDASDPARDTPPICMEHIQRWLSYEEASQFPAHVRCPHHISRTRVKDGQLPIYFLIGGVRYLAADLPDC